mgnify:FL=1
MSLKFVLGTAAKDHQASLLEQIKTISQTDPQAKIYYIVPNHIKFATEVSVLDHLRKSSGQDLLAATDIQVLSFSRLAWYFMKNEPSYQLPRLSAAGANMLVHKILRTKNDELTIFKSEQTQPGFVSQLAGQLVELSLALITSADLWHSYEMLEQSKDTDLVAKLHDLSIVYREFEQHIQGKYLGTANMLEALAKKLAQSDLSHSYFILDGFSQFNAGEYQIITSLLQTAKQVTVSLVLDRPYVHHAPEASELFYRSGQVYYRLYQLARHEHVKVLVDSFAKQDRVSADLVTLENYWIASNDLKPFTLTAKLQGDLQVIEAADRLEEVKCLATKIRQMVLLEGYRYQDFLLLTRHLDPYKNILQPTFEQFEIPFFTDLQKKMSDHPLVELIQALFLVDQRNYRYEDMMRLLKTELLLPKHEGKFMPLAEYRQALDLAENQVLKFGYRKKGWLGEAWVYYRFGTSDFGARTKNEDAITVKINLIKNYVKELLPPFYEKLAKANTGKAAASLLYEFLVAAGVVEQLDAWRKQALKVGAVDASTREEQVWGTFCDLLDEYVEILGEQPFEPQDFLDLLQAGFEGATYSQVPTTLDQVVISESGMVQPNDKKIVMLLGATDLVMPDVAVSEGLFSDHDKEMLQPTLSEKSYLPDDTEHVLANEPFLNYLAFLTPTQKLFLSYPRSDNDQLELKCSPYVERLKQALALPLSYAHKNDGASDALNYIGTKRTTMSELIKVERQALTEQQELPTVWDHLFQRFQQDPATKPLFEQLNQSLDYKNIPEQLTPESVKGLYGKELKTSISRLEDFYANPYEYFLKYGLGLKEREIFEMNAANTGEYFHTLLDTFFKLLLKNGQDLKLLKGPEFDAYFKESVELTKRLPQFKILDSSNRMRFLARQLNAAAKQVGGAIHKQRQFNNLKTIQTEALFGHVGELSGLAGLQFTTPNDRLVTVRGKIDRIDELVLGDKHYLSLVDYKSSAKKFDHVKAYFGLALQLLTYLDALLKNKTTLVKGATKEQIATAGAMYMHLYNPTFKQKEIYQTIYADEVLKKNKYNGLLLDQADVLEGLDESLRESSGNSLIYPFRRNKNGSYKASGAQLVTEAQLEALLLHNEELIKQATDMIFSGRIDLMPALFKDGSALQYTPYEAIMQFDPMLPENNYYRLPAEKPADILKLLQVKEEK